jgi:hypothetical protein
MARFDDVFAELQAKIGAAIAVIAANPELAVQVREAIDAAEAAEVMTEENRQDDARANVLQSVISDVGAVLREVAPLPTDEPPADPPADPPA